jgi:hypothetical protein
MKTNRIPFPACFEELPYLFRGAEAILTADAQEILTPSDQTPITTALQTAKSVMSISASSAFVHCQAKKRLRCSGLGTGQTAALDERRRFSAMNL